MNFDPASEVQLLPWLSAASALVLGVVFAWMSVRHPRALALRPWAAAWFCVSLANAGFALRGIAPDFVSIIVAHLLLQVGLLACLAGARRLNSAPPRRVDIPGWALVAVTISLLTWFTYQVPDLRVRILIVCICTALLSSRVALQLSDFALHRGNSLPADILAGLWWLLTVILLITAAATWVYGVNTQNMFQSNPAVHVLFQIRPVMALLIAVFCLWAQLLALKAESTEYFVRSQERAGASRIIFDQRCNDALASQGTLSVALIDLDNFQAIARLHGYAAAEAVIQWVGDSVRSHLRSHDVMEFYSHDQYALLLPETGREDARLLLEDIRRRMQRGNCTHEGQTLTTSLSMGLAISQPDRNTARAMISAARVALFQARSEGRNRIAIAHGNTPDIAPSRSGR